MLGMWLQSVPMSTIVAHLEIDYPPAPDLTTQHRERVSSQELTTLVQIVPLACNSIVSAALQAGIVCELARWVTWDAPKL